MPRKRIRPIGWMGGKVGWGGEDAVYDSEWKGSTYRSPLVLVEHVQDLGISQLCPVLCIIGYSPRFIFSLDSRRHCTSEPVLQPSHLRGEKEDDGLGRMLESRKNTEWHHAHLPS